MITLNLDVRAAIAIRQALFREQDGYTYDPTCVPARIVELRNVIVDLDEQIEEQLKEELKNETTDT